MTELSEKASGEECKQHFPGSGSPGRSCRGRLATMRPNGRGSDNNTQRGGEFVRTAPGIVGELVGMDGQQGLGQQQYQAVQSSGGSGVSSVTQEDSLSTASSSASAELLPGMMQGLYINQGAASGWEVPQFQQADGQGQGGMFRAMPNSAFTPQQAQQQHFGGQEGGMMHGEAFPPQQTQQARTVECDEDLFAMYVFKVVLCSKQFVHDWKECPYAHEGETARRRHPSHHTAQPCPDFKGTKMCPRGDKCQMAHGPWEAGLHPDAFRTNLCAYGRNCQRRMCFFAHDVAELRTPQPNALAQHILAASLQTHMSHKVPQQPFQLGGPAAAPAGGGGGIGMGKKPVGRGRDAGAGGVGLVGAQGQLTPQQQQQLIQAQSQQLQAQSQQLQAQSQQLQAVQQLRRQQQQQLPQQQQQGGLSSRRQMQGFAVYNASRQQVQQQQQQLGGGGLRVDVPVPNGSPDDNPLASAQWQGPQGAKQGGGARGAPPQPANSPPNWTPVSGGSGPPSSSGQVKQEDTSWVDKLLDSPL